MEQQDAVYDSIADLCVVGPGEDTVCYITDDEMGAGSAAVASWEAGRFKSAASMQHAGVTVAIVDRANTTTGVPTPLSHVPSYDVSGPSIHGWSQGGRPCRGSSNQGCSSRCCGQATVRARGVLECHLPVALAVLHAEWMGRGCASDAGSHHLFMDLH